LNPNQGNTVFTIREHGAKPHSNVYGDGRPRSFFYYSPEDPDPVKTYRQLYENGKPVPLDKQLRVAPVQEYQPVTKAAKKARFNVALTT
jgi:hypothetical protein